MPKDRKLISDMHYTTNRKKRKENVPLETKLEWDRFFGRRKRTNFVEINKEKEFYGLNKRKKKNTLPLLGAKCKIF